MRRLLLALVVSCTRPVAPAVTVSLPDAHDVATPEKTLLADCRVVGTGERAREATDEYDEGAPFAVFASERAREPAFVIARPAIAHVVWSRFPKRANDTRAQVHLGGQNHLRFDGWAELYGRTFTTNARLDSVRGHLWAHAGSPLDVMSDDGGAVFARVPTPFAAPKTIVVQANCADLRYEPNEPAPHRRKDPVVVASNRTASFQLFDSPTSGRPFTTITVKTDHSVSFDVIERTSGFVRVAGDEGHVGFDAWVPVAQVVDEPARDALKPPRLLASATDGRTTSLRHARVARDTPLLVGDAPAPLPGAFVEALAEVVWQPASSPEIVAFELADGFAVPPEGGRFWIRKDALER